MNDSGRDCTRALNIAIDVMPLYTNHSTRGIGSYVRNLIRALIREDRVNNYFLVNFYGNIPVRLKLRERERERERENGGCRELNYYETAEKWLHAKPSDERRQFFKSAVSGIIDQYAIDIYMVGAVVDPFFIYDEDLFERTKFVSVLHDVIPLVFGEHYLKRADTAQKYSIWFKQYLYSDYCYANSQASKDDLVRLLGVDTDRVRSIYAGVDPGYGKMTCTSERKNAVFEKYGIDGEYIFCVGADDFRKNLDSLTKAFLRLPPELLYKYQLVITCSLSKETISRLENYARESGVEGRVIATGYVSDSDMLCLLNSARLAAFPSMYEGFGLPVVEAWKCGVPVLTSNNSSLGEIAADAAVTVDPFSEDSIRDGLIYALSGADLDTLTERGAQACEQYTWENAARSVIDSYDDVIRLKKIDIGSAEYKKKVRDLKKACGRFAAT